MAQAKTRTRTSSRPTRSGNGGSARKPSSRKSTAKRKPTSAQARRSNSNGLVQKVKTPAIAAGAMLVGLAGGATAMRNGKRHKSRIPRPKLKLSAPTLPKSHGSTAKWVGEKAQSLGDAGHRVADLTDQVAKVEKTLRK